MLAALALHPNRWAHKDRLAEYLWSEPLPSSEPNLRTYGTKLRRALDACLPGLGDRLQTMRGGGFLLRTEPHEVDAHAFVHLAVLGGTELRAGNHAGAAAAITEGLRLWRGPPGADLPDTVPFRERLGALDRRRRHALADLCQARLHLDDAISVVPELHQLVAEEPLAERPVRLLMHALHHCGERAGALASYHAFRARLADQTGADPSGDLQGLFLRLLRDHGQSRSARAASAAQ